MCAWLIEQARQQRASDISIKQNAAHIEVHFRVDGILHTVAMLDTKHHRVLCDAFKTHANLDTSDRSRPQYAHHHVAHLDVHTWSIPTAQGESIKLALQPPLRTIHAWSTLGLRTEQQQRLCEHLHIAQGLVVIGGPAGSGLEKTIDAIIDHLRAQNLQVSILHDEMALYAQHQLEVYDGSQQIVIVPELLGHQTIAAVATLLQRDVMVITSFNAHNTSDILTRLERLEINPAHLTTTLVAQRQYRRLCTDCRVQADAFYQAQGCPRCQDTGYFETIGVFELMQFINNTRHQTELLHDASWSNVTDGVTSLQEHQRHFGRCDQGTN